MIQTAQYCCKNKTVQWNVIYIHLSQRVQFRQRDAVVKIRQSNRVVISIHFSQSVQFRQLNATVRIKQFNGV